MPVFERIPKRFFRCSDGTYSTTDAGGACAYHGGLAVPVEPVKMARQGARASRDQVKPGDVVLVPVQGISVRHEWFQGRATPYSVRSVENIVQAVAGGTFRWSNMDPVTLWLAPDGKLYMLSGHSRLEAFRQLCEAGAVVDGRNFCELPAKIETEITLEQAKEIALQSNTLSTKETPLERANFYRRARIDRGDDPQELLKLARRLEGKDARTIIAYSYLNPAGKTYNALELLEGGQAESRTVIANVARWIGNARMNVPQLTDFHENELYEWLVTNKGYGTSRGQMANENDFRSRLQSIINRRTTFGRLEDTLNIQANITLSPVEAEYNAQLEAARQEVKDLERELKAKIRELRGRDATEAQIQEITQGLEASLRRARIRYQDLISKRGDVAEAARNELSLFAGIRGQNQYTMIDLPAGIGCCCQRRATVGLTPPPSLGKVFDYPDIKPGSRIDEYWLSEVAIDTSFHGKREFPHRTIFEVVERYGLHSLEFGNWVTQEERYQALYAIGVSLEDLADVLRVARKKIGLHKHLSISFGARGRGGRAAATYHPSIHHINLTKPHGEGSLAHEYGHALDYELGQRTGEPPSGGNSTSFSIYRGKTGGAPADLMEQFFEILYYDGKEKPTDFALYLSGLTDYWKQRNEVWARSFEKGIYLLMKDAGIKNTFLAKGSWYEAPEYPPTRLLRKALPIMKKIAKLAIG